MSELATVGIDLAKNVFQVHGVDENGRVLVRRKLRRGQLLAFFQRQPRCLIGMEACAGSHDWARRLQAMGHDVRLMPPSYVKAEVGRVTDAVLALPGVDGRIALLGHSMASDIIVRRAQTDPRIAATVTISMFSEAVTKAEPRNLLMITGGWEQFLRTDALRNARLADPAANEGETIGDPAQNTGRRAVAAPNVEHVGVLYSATALREARSWLDAVFGRTSNGPVAATGGWILLLLAGLVVLDGRWPGCCREASRRRCWRSAASCSRCWFPQR